jgi:Flp pilus assembly protein TadD
MAQAADTNILSHEFYFQLGAACERAGDYPAAEKHFQKCLQLSPEFAEALNYLGYMWADRGEHLDQARDMIERAVKQEPENEAFLDSLGWVLFRQGQAAPALEYLQKAQRLSEKPDAEMYDHLGEVFNKLGQVDKAVEAWKKSLEIEPKDIVRKKLDAVKGP